MIDLHCHLLPGIDDGPQTLEESLVLAKLAVRNGITHAITTPHIHPGRWDNDRFQIARLTNRFRLRLAHAGIPLKLGMAAEVRVDAELMRRLADDKIPFLGHYNGKRVILLELPHSHIPLGTDNLIAWLLQRNIQPLIAHPERNAEMAARGLKRLSDVRTPIIGSVLNQVDLKAQNRYGEYYAADYLTQGKSLTIIPQSQRDRTEDLVMR